VRVGVAHHLGWAVVVTATADHEVVDRRRIELIESGLPAAPVHHEGGAHAMHRSGEPPDDAALASLVAEVRASAVRTTGLALDEMVASLPETVTSISLRAWPVDFPHDIGTQRRAPYESQADSVMYRQVLAELAKARRWAVHGYGKDVEAEAARLLRERAEAVLHGPRSTLGPPWTKDHRSALAATVVAQSLGRSP